MTEADATVDSLAQRLAAQGRDALVDRLRGAYADAAAAHSDIVRLDDARIEQMVQDAADRADGLQWRRALATVAAQELGIELSGALSHPAVAQAQKLVGAPSYEDSLSELVERRYEPVSVPTPPVLGDGGPLAAVPTEPEAAPDPEPEAEAELEREPEPEPEPEFEPEPEPEFESEPELSGTAPVDTSHHGEAVIEEPEPLDDAAHDDDFLPPPTPLRPVIAEIPLPAVDEPSAGVNVPVAADLAGGGALVAGGDADGAEPPAADPPDEEATAVHHLEPAGPHSTDGHHPPPPTHTIGGDISAHTATPSARPGGPVPVSDFGHLQPVESTVADAFEEHGPPAEHDHPTAAWSPHDEGAWDDEDEFEDDEHETHPAEAHPALQQAPLPLDDDDDDELRLSAFHLGGVANLPTGKDPIDVLLSAHGLDILRPTGEIIGRLGWTEIENLEVPQPRGRRRRRAKGDQATLIVRTRHGDASFEVPGFNAEELRDLIEPTSTRFSRLARPSY